MKALARAALSLLLPLAAAAQQSGPEALVRNVTVEVLEAITADPELQAGDRRKALALAEKKVLPHVDFRQATQLAAGKSWAAATPAQRERLVSEFRRMLVRVYSSSLGVYRGQLVRVLPVRMAPGDTEVTVRNHFLKPGQPPVLVDYAMHQTPEGWKIYDVVIEGVSLVLTYRSEFEVITRQSGIEGLIQRLAEKNA